MKLDELNELKTQVLSLSLEPLWCENIELLKKYIAGFEDCQSSMIRLIELKIKNVTVQNDEAEGR